MKNVLKTILKYKSDIIAYISSFLIILGTILPIVIIEGVSKSFISENGKLVLACAIIGAILYLFKVGYFSFIPAIGSLAILFIFYNGINESMEILNKLNSGSAFYSIGFYLIIIGSVLLIISSIINFFDIKKNHAELSNEVQDEVIVDEIAIPYEQETKTISSSVLPVIKDGIDTGYIYCIHCGAIIKKESKMCNFCDSQVNDNNM